MGSYVNVMFSKKMKTKTNDFRTKTKEIHVNINNKFAKNTKQYKSKQVYLLISDKEA